MKLIDYLSALNNEKGEYFLELYINGELSLFCEVSDAIKTFQCDKRGELIVPNGSVAIYEYSSNVSGIFGRIHIRVDLWYK